MKIIPDVVNNQTVVTVSTDASACEAAELMVKNNISAVLVTDGGGKLAGIVTERDITRCFAENKKDGGAAPIEEIMTAGPDTVDPGDMARDALQLMELNHYRHLPVVNGGGEIVGILSLRDLYSAIKDMTDRTLADTQSAITRIR